MNDFTIAILLGIIEGLTEFLPISSTAHLRLVQSLLGIDLSDEFWKVFAIVIQLGAILSVVIYFWKRLVDFHAGFWRTPKKGNHPLTLIGVTFVVTALPAFLLSRVIEDNLESLTIIGYSLLIGGVVMWAVDFYFQTPKVHKVEDMKVSHAITIGLVQILSAVFPGVSRSMSTLAAGQAVGLSRAAALEFSFFVSIPVMFAATGYELLKSVLHQSAEGLGSNLIWTAKSWSILGVGFVISFLVAYVVNAWFMNWVKSRGFLPFAIYRILLGIGILAVL